MDPIKNIVEEEMVPDEEVMTLLEEYFMEQILKPKNDQQ